MHQNAAISTSKTADTMVVCETSRGSEIRGTVLRMTRHEVSFEIYAAADMVQMSEVLGDFKILVRNRIVYSGHAVVSSLVNAGPLLVCQASLQGEWMEIDILHLARTPVELEGAFRQLIRDWQRLYKILPEYKLIIADIQSFLFELRHWVQEAELGIHGAGNSERTSTERDAAKELLKSVVPCLNHLFENFEVAATHIDRELHPAYCLYARRQLHPLLLCAPFMHRIYRKPLGYAGDYEMVNMILRDPHEGTSLFAKVLNHWFLSQIPAEAHRNRVRWLTQRLVEETARTRLQNRPLRVYNLGCGPAKEVYDFIEQSDLSNNALLTLVDFNEETLSYTRRTLEQIRTRANRATRVQLVKKSVAGVLKAGMRSVVAEYDLVYCAGLFDYLPEYVCRQLVELFYGMLAPGGLLIATNVESSNPIRNIMGFIFEWWLIERNAPQMRALVPRREVADECQIVSDPTGCNLFLEIRKPNTSP